MVLNALGVVFGMLLAYAFGVIILSAFGFTSTGVASGSFAALWQSTIGNVVGGSVFAVLQGVAARTAGFSGCAVIAVFTLLYYLM